MIIIHMRRHVDSSQVVAISLHSSVQEASRNSADELFHNRFLVWCDLALCQATSL